MIVSFEEWTNRRTVYSLGTNWRATALPFQDWRRFKEAFAPELVERAVAESQIHVETCLDPFAGSGTTPLACQFLGVRPIAIEVNPFLADLTASKLSLYNPKALTHDLDVVMATAKRGRRSPATWFEGAPQTFLEPGFNDRWIFDFAVATRIVNLLGAVEALANKKHKRLFRVLIGGILVEVSNVITSGKGRRYRRNWVDRRCDPRSVFDIFFQAAKSAIGEIDRYSQRPRLDHQVICGDARLLLDGIANCELSVFSPPYPNSFDYTDVYNVELWALGYLRDKVMNKNLRKSTLSSHVQILRDFAVAPTSSRELTRILKRLRRRRSALWNSWIPEMIGAYFGDMQTVLQSLIRVIKRRGSVWIVVGDSQYAESQVRTSLILADIAHEIGWQVHGIEPFRSMRSSAQQGGESALEENLLVLTRR